MYLPTIFEKYPKLRHYVLPLLFGLSGLVLLVYGLISSLDSNSSDEVVFESDEPVAEAKESGKKELVVDVSGQVVNPGIYRLSANTRVHDAIIAAGGLSAEANRDWVAKHINLAAKVSDASKIYIPALGESSITTSTGSTSIMGNSEVAGVGQININTASETELDSLPGVGKVTSQKIISNRPYASIEELLSKKVVGRKVFEQIKDKISLY